MKLNITYKVLIPLVASLSLGACNIEPISDEKKEEIRKTAAEEIKKTFTGVIDNLDTLKVNGVEFDTENAKIYVNGKEVDYSQLELGMVVTVSGTDKQNGTGVALSVEYDQQLSGLVVNNNFGADGTLDVMGQTVYVNSSTVIDSDDDSAININDISADYTVEVSGYTAGDGKIWATRVEVKVIDDAEEMEIEGEIYNAEEGSFMIGELTIVYEPANFDNSITSQLFDGVYVEVSSVDGYNDSDELVANEIDVKYSGRRSFDYENDDDEIEVEVEGVITKVISEIEIEVNGTTILLTDLSSTPATLSEGDRVEVKAEIDADGNLNVLQIEREDDSEGSDDSGEDDDSGENDDSDENDNSDENDDSDANDNSNGD